MVAAIIVAIKCPPVATCSSAVAASEDTCPQCGDHLNVLSRLSQERTGSCFSLRASSLFVFYSGFAIIMMDLIVTGRGGGVGTEGHSLGGALQAGCFHTLVAVDSLARHRWPMP